MEWSTYKRLCDRPDYFSRWMLDQCNELLYLLERGELAGALARGTASEPLTMPQITPARPPRRCSGCRWRPK